MSSSLSDREQEKLEQLWAAEGIQAEMMPFLEGYGLPLAEAIASQAGSLSRPLIQGVLGGQGTGKTTLCLVLKTLLNGWGIQTESLSLDDLYKPYADRQILQAQDPRLTWRGPPSTHDVSLGLSTIGQVLRRSPSLALPQFDKYAQDGQGDRGPSRIITPVDVLLFEGWFVGVRPIPPERFDHAPEPIVTEGDRQFARDMNQALEAYEPLWDQLDSLLVLNPVDYRLSLDWRWEAESKAIAQGKTGMSQDEITAFVHYFWKALHPTLFITPLIHSGIGINYVIEIGQDHCPVKLYSPA